MTIKVTAIVGSIRKDSMNRKLVEFIQQRYADKLTITLAPLNDVPMFNPDIEETPPQAAKDFKNQVKEAEAVLFAVPEYNFSIPSVLKNGIDWLSRAGLDLRGKPAFIVGSSMGVLGSVRAQMHLRDILSNPSLSPMLLPNNEVYIGAIHEKLNENGEIIDKATIDFLDKVVDNFVDFYQKLAN